MDRSDKYRLIVITNGNLFACRILRKLLTQRRELISGLVLVTGDYRGRNGLQALIEWSKVTSPAYVLYKVFTYLLSAVITIIHPRSLVTVDRLARKLEIPAITTVSIKSPEIQEWIVSQHPDLLVSVSCPQMIGKQLLSQARLGGINIHSSLLPAYAGLAPYFWVLSEGEVQSGITVHYMTLNFDQGNVLTQRRVVIDQGESAFHLFTRLADEGSEALYEAVELTLSGEPGMMQDLSNYTYFSNPTQNAYLNLRRRGHSLIKPNDVKNFICWSAGKSDEI